MASLTITTLGRPRPKQSARFTPGGRIVGIASANKSLKLWTLRLVQASREALEGTDPALLERLQSGAVRLDATYYMPIKDPKKWGKPHTARPDRDNLLKATQDALQKAGVLKDDSAICDGNVTKRYARDAGVVLVLTPDGENVERDDVEDLGVDLRFDG